MSRRAETSSQVPVKDVLPAFADAFPFERFNEMQSAVVPALLDSDENVVVSAPTASGKTAVAEAAICQTLSTDGTALFLAPLRALTNEKEREWERFEELGYSVYVVTGERDLHPRRAKRADILVMTPEKADSATRKHDSRRYSFVEDIDCCVIDEVHLLDSDGRGSVLEVTISRLRRLCDPRVVALSATMSNAEDVAAWLDAPEETTFAFDDSVRPVPLEADVAIYSHGENAFADKYRRLYRALDLAEPHIREDGQALVFVASRQDTVQAAKKARDELAARDIPVGARGDYEFHQAAEQLQNDTLRQSVLDGVGFHHAGLARKDKNLVEEWFRDGTIELLFSTSTLAWGVNLPARCVVIRDTTHHDPLEGEVEMSPLDILQMLGRAGRPGYDDQGYAWVVCDGDDASRYRRLLSHGKNIESRLAERSTGADGPASGDLATHLNAEIALGNVRSVEDAMDWLETTFYWVRAQQASAYASGDDLSKQVRATLDWLVSNEFIEMDGSAVEPTPLGRLASDYYLDLPTARQFADLTDGELTSERALRAVSAAEEFDSVSARSAEQDAIDAVLGEQATGMDAGNRKVLAILRSGMNTTTPTELRSDAWVIRQNAQRLLSALRAIVDRFGDPTGANLVRRLEARVETGISDDAVGLTAIDGIGSTRASSLAAAGYQSPADVATATVSELTAAGLADGVAERVHKSASELPAIEVDWGAFPETVARGERTLCEVTVESVGGSARAGLSVLVREDEQESDSGVEMTTKDSYLGQTTLPVGVFGGSADRIEYSIRVVFPDLPLAPVERSKVVRVE